MVRRRLNHLRYLPQKVVLIELQPPSDYLFQILGPDHLLGPAAPTVDGSLAQHDLGLALRDFVGAVLHHDVSDARRCRDVPDDDLFLIFHLMIAGRFRWRDKGKLPRGRNELATFEFPTGTLLMTEAGALATLGAAVGLTLMYVVLLIARPMVETQFGLFIEITLPSSRDWAILGMIIGAGGLVGIIPAIRAYRYSLADGMTVRI